MQLVYRGGHGTKILYRGSGTRYMAKKVPRSRYRYRKIKSTAVLWAVLFEKKAFCFVLNCMHQNIELSSKTTLIKIQKPLLRCRTIYANVNFCRLHGHSLYCVIINRHCNKYFFTNAPTLLWLRCSSTKRTLGACK